MPASPITLSKIIKPQEHQTDFHDDKKFYLKKRRSRRGRPKRDEYAYVCDEKCSWCGGAWGKVVDVAKDGKNAESETDEKKLEPIDLAFLDDDEAKLVRCKDCREAFHPSCMKLNGEEIGALACKEEAKSEEIHSVGDVRSDAVNDGDGTSAARGSIEMELEKNEDTEASSRTNIASLVTGSNEVTSSDESKEEMDSETKAPESEEANASMDVEDVMDAVDIDDCKVDCAAFAAASESTDGDATSTSNDHLLKEEDQTDVPIDNSQPKPAEQGDVQEDSKPRRCPRVLVRCCKCETMRRLGIEPDAGKGADQDIKEKEGCGDITPPAKKVCSFKLEAIIDGRTVLCTVNPVPVLEANVNGKTVVCHAVFGGCNEKKNGEGLEKSTSKNRQMKRKIAVAEKKTKDPVTRKVERLMTKAIDGIANVSVQSSSIMALRELVDGPVSTSSVVKAGGLELLVNAMENHPNVADIQSESIKTMTEIIWYCQSLGMNLVEEGCLELATLAMEDHGTHVEIQKLAIELFRALSSFDVECCKAMFEADIVRVVMSAMKRNPKVLVVLTEARLD